MQLTHLANRRPRITPRRRTGPSVVVIVIGVLTALLSACVSEETTPTTDSQGDQAATGNLRAFELPYTLYDSLIADLPIAVAIEKGFFAKHGLAPRIVPTSGGGASVRALTASSAPLGVVSTTSAIPAALTGEDIRLVGRVYNGTTYRWLANQPSGITEPTADQLRGKRFAITTPGGSSDSQLTAILKKAGLARSDVEIVPAGDDSNIVILFDEGRVDVAPIGEIPAAVRIAKGAPMLVQGIDTIKGIFSASVVAKTKTIESDPQLIRDFFAALDEAKAWVLANPDSEQLIDIAARKMRLPANERESVRSVVDFYVQNSSHWWKFQLDDTEVQVMVDLLKDQGDLDKPVSDLGQVMSRDWQN